MSDEPKSERVHTDANQWQNDIQRWLAALYQTWGLEQHSQTPAFTPLWLAWTQSPPQSIAAALASRDALHAWRDQLPSEMPPLPDWRQALRTLAPLTALMTPAASESMGPSSMWQQRCSKLESRLGDCQQATLALASGLAGVLADGLGDYARTAACVNADEAERLAEWSSCVQARYEQAITTGDLSERLADYWSSAARARVALTAMMDELAPALGLPSRAELADTQARLARLERRQHDDAPTSL